MSVADVCGNSKNPPDTKPPSLIVNGTFDRPHTSHEGDQQQPPAAAFIIGGQDAQSGQFPCQTGFCAFIENVVLPTPEIDLSAVVPDYCEVASHNQNAVGVFFNADI